LVRFLRLKSVAYKVRAPKTPVICLARRASSAWRYIEVVEIDECRKLSRTGDRRAAVEVLLDVERHLKRYW